jgi:hypothetical protein
MNVFHDWSPRTRTLTHAFGGLLLIGTPWLFGFQTDATWLRVLMTLAGLLLLVASRNWRPPRPATAQVPAKRNWRKTVARIQEHQR